MCAFRIGSIILMAICPSGDDFVLPACHTENPVLLSSQSHYC